jgi:DNA repair exonuclease SbcCD ATPase subunit
VIEAAMYVALGVLATGLAALIVLPPFWRRAVRLTRRDIEMTLPMTPAEIAADRDQLRADYALSTRRLESTIEKLETRVAGREVELGEKRALIAHLSAEQSLASEGMGRLERERGELLGTLAERERRLGEADETGRTAEKRMQDMEARLDAARRQLEAVVAEREAQKLEVIARETELANLRDQIRAAGRQASEAGTAGAALAELRATLAGEQMRREAALGEIAAGAAARRALDAELKTANAAADALRAELAAAKDTIANLEARLAAAPTPALPAPPAAAMDDDRQALPAKIAAMEAAARAPLRDGAAPADNGALRQSLLDIGAAVAKLAREEGPKAIEAPVVLPVAPVESAAAPPVIEVVPVKGEAPMGLAARIRALQQRYPSP